MQSDGHTLSCYKENTTCEVHHINAAHLDIQNVSSRMKHKMPSRDIKKYEVWIKQGVSTFSFTQLLCVLVLHQFASIHVLNAKKWNIYSLKSVGTQTTFDHHTFLIPCTWFQLFMQTIAIHLLL